jgi:hypothetical protein
MAPGFVARFSGLDLAAVHWRLQSMGAICVAPRRPVRRSVLENDHLKGKQAQVTVVSDGERQVVAVVPRQGGPGLEVRVDDFGIACRLMEEIGLAPSAFEETYRADWRLHDVQLVLTDWPGVPHALEIAGPGEEQVRWAAQQLGLDLAQAEDRQGVPLEERPAAVPPEQAVPQEALPQEALPLNPIEMGWSSAAGFDPGVHFLQYAVVFHNRNLGHFCAAPEFRVTVRDAAGYVIGTDEAELPLVPPGGRVAWAEVVETNAPPATLEITCKSAEWEPTAARPEQFAPLGHQGVRFKNRGEGCLVTGEVVNPYPQPVDNALVVALFRGAQGEIIGGEVGSMDALAPLSATPFKLEGIVAKAVTVDLIAIPAGDGPADPWRAMLRL